MPTIPSLGMPLHPLVVHFPIALSVLLPIFVAGALRAIRKGTTPRRAWALPIVVAAALTASAWVATETGESEEERVEAVVAESAIHGHEEAAERFLALSGVLLLVTSAGLLPRTVGQAARLLAAAGSIGLLAAGVQVGHSGGTLVYRHGAASAYITDSANGARERAPSRAGERVTRRDDDDGR